MGKEIAMKWTKNLPDKIGWWFRRSKPKHLNCWVVDVVCIYQQDGQFMVEQCTCHKVPLKGFEPESREDWMQDEWAGPIKEPEESKDA